jgi:hypothetical protein
MAQRDCIDVRPRPACNRQTFVHRFNRYPAAVVLAACHPLLRDCSYQAVVIVYARTSVVVAWVKSKNKHVAEIPYGSEPAKGDCSATPIANVRPAIHPSEWHNASAYALALTYLKSISFKIHTEIAATATRCIVVRFKAFLSAPVVSTTPGLRASRKESG